MSLHTHPLDYRLSCCEICCSFFTSPYASRHTQMASTSPSRKTHRFLHIAGRIPVVSLVVTIAECCFGRCHRPSTPHKPIRATPLMTDKIYTQICKRRIGLRHVTGNLLAEQEGKEGFKMGCSLNINPCLSDHLQTTFEKFSQEERCRQLEQRIKGFIHNSLIYDIGQKYDPARPPMPAIALGGSRVRDIAKFLECSRFCIVSYSEYRGPTDFSGWGEGLGRFPKHDVSPEDIHYIPVLDPGLIGDTTTQDKVIATKEQGDRLYDQIVHIIYAEVIKWVIRPSEDTYLSQMADLRQRFPSVASTYKI